MWSWILNESPFLSSSYFIPDMFCVVPFTRRMAQITKICLSSHFLLLEVILR